MVYIVMFVTFLSLRPLSEGQQSVKIVVHRERFYDLLEGGGIFMPHHLNEEPPVWKVFHNAKKPALSCQLENSPNSIFPFENTRFFCLNCDAFPADDLSPFSISFSREKASKIIFMYFSAVLNLQPVSFTTDYVDELLRKAFMKKTNKILSFTTRQIVLSRK